MKKRFDERIQPTLFEVRNLEPADAERLFYLPGLFLGTSSFTASGWEGSSYPIGMRSKDFLRHYSGQFQTVEIDSTFYGTPAASTVTSWNERTPQDFIFAVKVPQLSCTTESWWTVSRSLMSSSKECACWAKTWPNALAIPKIRQVGA